MAQAHTSMWGALRQEFAELLLPQRCVVCSDFGAALHAACLEELPCAGGQRCDRCWAPLVAGSWGASAACERCGLAPPLVEAKRAAFRFEGAARLAILEAKFRGVSALLPPLAHAAAGAVDLTWGIEAVAWVPLHPSRLRRRGYDQGQAIAVAAARVLEVPVRGDLIRRVRATSAQAALGRAERARNVEDAFAPRSGRRRTPPTRVLLVDDVATTGATLEAAARALHGAGVEHVFGLTLAIED